MLRRIFHTAFGILLLGLMILVPTDLLRIGMDTMMNGDSIRMTMGMELESDIDHEDKEESKEKHKEKNKISIDSSHLYYNTSSIEACGSSIDNTTFGHPLAHYLEVSTPPPEVS